MRRSTGCASWNITLEAFGKSLNVYPCGVDKGSGSNNELIGAWNDVEIRTYRPVNVVRYPSRLEYTPCETNRSSFSIKQGLSFPPPALRVRNRRVDEGRAGHTNMLFVLVIA